VRSARKGENAVKRFTAAVFYRLLRRLTNVSIPVDTGDFRIMSRRTVEVLKNMPERHRFYGHGFMDRYKQTGSATSGRSGMPAAQNIPFKNGPFRAGCHYLVSVAPLRFVVWLGFLSAGTGIAYSLYVLYIKIFTLKTVAGCHHS